MSNAALRWVKSSYSNPNQADCVEIACNWVKSSYSNPDGAACVEIAAHPSAIHIRDSKTPEAPYLTITPTTWSAFLATASSPLR
ncbi:DUF397 domain-containing protein [Streptomyces roseirectus]|uniref:DUF397 domain-containing protein n=1 Tax=Streptomyces roseirectus TaxID=2768066 RepID=A0A7H0IFF4_9ACTN|nr:DUF397 domain-containing protein [Streptomyces roseirectus]QNP71520.1 DUF397 domain-containing protein [Streptomyces roseirectus]